MNSKNIQYFYRKANYDSYLGVKIDVVVPYGYNISKSRIPACFL